MTMSKSRRNLCVCLLSFTISLLYFIPYVRYTLYDQTVSALNLTNTQMGLLGSVYGAVTIPSYAIGAALAQKYKPKYLISFSLVVMGLLGLWHASLPSFNVLLLIHVLYALFSVAFPWSAALTLLRSFGTDEEQGRLFGTNEALRCVATALYSFVFLYIFGRFTNEAVGYRAILIIAAVVHFIFAVITFMVFPTEIRRSEPKKKSSAQETMMALKLPGVWLAGVFILFCTMLNLSSRGYFGTYSTQVLNTSPTISSVLQVFRSYIIPIGLSILAGILADKAKYRSHFLMILLAIIGVMCAVMPFLNAFFWPALIITTVIAALNMALKSTFFSIMNEALIPRDLTGAGTGFVSLIAYLPDAFLSAMVGAWLDKNVIGGFNKLFIMMTFCAVGGIILAAIINKRYVAVVKAEQAEKAEQ